MTRPLARSILLATFLLGCEKAPLAPTEDSRRDATVPRAANVPCFGCGLERLTLEVTDLVLLGDGPGQFEFPMFGKFSCESGQTFQSFTGTAVADNDPEQVGAFLGELIMPPFQQSGDMGPFSVQGGVELPDGTVRTGFFMSDWSPGARSCSITDGVMRISINTTAGAAISGVNSNGDNVSGSVTGFLSGYIDIASDMVVISSGFTMRMLNFTDPGEITITPDHATHDVAIAHTMTATVHDLGARMFREAQPVSGVSVVFSITGSVTTVSQCITNAAGQCTLSYGGPRSPVTDNITAFADINGDGVMNLGEPSAVSTVVWGDNEPPVIAAPPDLTTSTTPGACSATISSDALGTATATDNSGSASITGPSAGVYPLGTTSLAWTATDPAGNASTATQMVTVIDEEAPTLATPANITVETDAGRDNASVDVGIAAASDNCEGVNVVGTRSDDRGLAEGYPVGTTTIMWIVTDASGNVSTGTQTVTVTDVEPPVLTLPASLLVNATGPNGAPVVYGESAGDNVAVTSLVCVPASGSTVPIGSTVVTCIASDQAGNQASGSFPLTVLGAAGQIVNLIEYVKGAMIPSTFRTYLVALLQRVLSDPRSTPYACSALDLFIAGVRTRSGTVIPADKVVRIIEDATRIRAVLGCK